MSYQFEDESVLEELLNQQLDRNRVKSAQTIKQKAQDQINQAASSITITSNRGSNLATWLNKDPQVRDSEAANSSVLQLTEVTSKPSDVIQPVNSRPSSGAGPIMAKACRPQLVEKRDQVDLVTGKSSIQDENSAADISIFASERELQQMSKQRLIRLIIDELEPSIRNEKSSRERHEVDLTKVAQLEKELLEERDKQRSLVQEEQNRLRIAEASWMQLNKQLERRLELVMNELAESSETNRKILSNFEQDQKKQFELLAETYKTRIEDQRLQFVEELRRTQELHKLEMTSKLRVNADLSKLESIYNTWHQTIKSTIEQLDVQFASVERLMDKQTCEIRGTSENLAEKSSHLAEQSAEFRSKLDQFVSLMDSNRSLISQLAKKVETNSQLEDLMRKMGNQFEEFTRLNQQLSSKQQSIVEDLESLNRRAADLNSESTRLSLESKRLELLASANDAKETNLTEQQQDIQRLTMQVQAKKASCELKLSEIRAKFDKIQLVQKRQESKEKELTKWQMDLAEERKSLRKEITSVERKLNKLTSLRMGTHKELKQLERLQKSLVCSTCLDRLCKVSKQVENGH